MSSFTDPLILEDLGTGSFLLHKLFRYHVGALGSDEVITVPLGFTTDFASVPRIFWSIVPPHGRHGKAAVIHDLLYSTRGLGGRYSRKRCDEIFLEAMLVLKVHPAKAAILFRAVRIFGGMRW